METNTPQSIKELHQRNQMKQVEELIARNGYACVTFLSDDTGEGHPYHHTVGLNAMGYADIFISGRIPEGAARALIEKVVDKWRAAGKTKVGTFNNFAKLTSPGWAPVRVVKVDPQPRIQEKTEFLYLMRHYAPKGQPFEVVQLLFPDDKGHLPDTRHYTTDPEYLQELLPVVPK